MIKITVDDEELQAAFVRLRAATTDLKPLMQDLGEILTETTKRRFETSTAPDGSRWAPNAESTYVQFAGRYKGGLTKKGRVNARGARRIAGKKPLIGESKSLSTTIHSTAGADFVEIGSSMIYAGVQQFGAKKHSFTGGKTPWADIPARPFLGVSDEDAKLIAAAIDEHLERATRK